MKLTIKHPTGAEVAFEGDLDEFKVARDFLLEPPPMVEALGTARAVAGLPPGATAESRGDLESTSDPLEPSVLNARMEELGASTDIERVTVMAHASVEAGQGGIDYDTAERLYNEMGLPVPAKIRSTFFNAKTRGLLMSAGRGRWRPTVTGQNFARLGQRPTRRGGPRAVVRPQLSIPNEGGDND